MSIARNITSQMIPERNRVYEVFNRDETGDRVALE